MPVGWPMNSICPLTPLAGSRAMQPHSPPSRTRPSCSRQQCEHVDQSLTSEPDGDATSSKPAPALLRRSSPVSGRHAEHKGSKGSSAELPRDWSVYVEHLIRETELAFQNTDAANFRLSSSGLDLYKTFIPDDETEDLNDSSPFQTTRSPSQPLPPPPAAASSSSSQWHLVTQPREGNEELSRNPASRDEVCVEPQPSGKRAADAVKLARVSAQTAAAVGKTVKKIRTKKHANRGRHQRNSSLRNISENVADILTGQRFRKVAADEMLTPERLRQLKQLREEAERQALPEPADSSQASFAEGRVGDSAPTDVSVGYPPASETAERPAPPGNRAAHGGETGEDRTGTVVQDSQAARRREPDICGSRPSCRDSALARGNGRLPRHVAGDRDRPVDVLEAEQKEEFLYLQSTPYSLTKPMFKHGPIALSKAAMGEAAMTMDDSLDWTAFQMAILGGAGEFTSGQVEEDAGRMAEDLTVWFDSFGFETHGEMILGDAPPQRVSGCGSMVSCSSGRASDVELPIPTFVGAGGEPRMVHEPLRFAEERHVGQWPCHPADGALEVRPLVVGRGGSGDIDESTAERVPMRCNMNEDLDAFLRWEAQHLSSAGGL